MTRRRYVFDPPDRFVAGTIGVPGQRAFFLQARDAGRIVSVALEKVQVAVLADRLNQLLDELESQGIAESTPAVESDGEPLDEPLNEAFRAGILTLGWDGDRERILVEAQEQTEDDDAALEAAGSGAREDEDGPDLLTVRITPPEARAFVERAARVVASGRPACPVCGQPLDPTGHICPRRNGHYVN
jgi:uncharacterized repeat protein (TIGR03847 family)